MKKHKRLNDIVTLKWEQMDLLRIELGIQHNDVFCGYLRQPIKAIKLRNTEDNKIQYCIQGNCALYDTFCRRNVVFLEHFDNQSCDRYKKYF